MIIQEEGTERERERVGEKQWEKEEEERERGHRNNCVTQDSVVWAFHTI